MQKIYTIIAIIALALGGGFYMLSKYNELRDLREQVRQAEITSEYESLHLDREAERLKALSELEAKGSNFAQEAIADKSDAGSTFSASRVKRLNQIK